jgi:coenzyme PQQ precursor peptide PqqA
VASDGRFGERIFSSGLLIWGTAGFKIKKRSRQKAFELLGEEKMQWTAPVFEEVCLNCEINSYVSAKL